MYVPAFTAMDDEQARALVAEVGSGWLITNSVEGPPAATLMPLLWRGDTVIAHMAKANPHWRTIAGGAPGLVIVTGAEAYVSPSWYAAKVEHGRVVPTWNYLAVHLSGAVQVHHDPDWLLAAVTDLTNRRERLRRDPWSVSDAPADYIRAQLKAIAGVEMRVEHVEGKAKLSQNRSEADQSGVIEGLRQQPDDPGSAAIAAAMAAGRDMTD
jgi:transcriptional regulator